MFDAQGYDPNRPIPYIVDYSPTGVMTIGWDRLMTPFQNFTIIPPTKIAVAPEVFTQLDQDNSSRR